MSRPAKRLAEFLSDNPIESEPVPEPLFRNFVVPGELIDLLASKKIADAEIILVGIMDSLVKAKEEGCWASKAYLAKRLGKTERQIHRMMANLKDLGLIRQVGTKTFPNGAVLPTYETIWHPVDLFKELACTDVRGRQKCHPGGRQKCHPIDSSLRSESQKEIPTRRNRLGRAIDDPLEESPPGGNTSMPFDGFKTPPDDKIKRHHLDLAERLRSATVAQGYKTSWKRSKWADQFRLLENDLKGDRLGGLKPDDLYRVLEWFEKQATSPNAFKVHNAEIFRKMFLEMARRSKSKQPLTVQVSDKAKAIADKFRGRFSNYRWPKGSADCLDAFVQVTLTGANEFRDRLKTVAKSDDKRKKDNMAAVLLKTKFMYFDHPDTFTEKWVQAVYDDIKDWDGWSGNLVSMAFAGDLDQKRMDRIGKQWATDYFGYDKPWTELKESLR